MRKYLDMLDKKISLLVIGSILISIYGMFVTGITISATTDSTHPNMYLNASEIETIKQRIESDQQPWKTAYDKFMSEDVPWAMKLPIQSVTFGGITPLSRDRHDYFSDEPYCGWTRVDGKKPDCRDGQYNPQADRTDYTSTINMGKAVRSLGLAYVLTGDEKYADKAIQLINGWTIDPSTRMNPKFTNPQSYTELTFTMTGMFYGADLIWNYPGWSSSDKDTFKLWAADFIESAKTWSAKDNYEDLRLLFIASASVIANDTNSRQYAFDKFKAIIDDQITDKGEIKYELNRTTSLSYSVAGINAMIQLAEIARHYDIDLYNYNVDGRGIELALDYHLPYVLNLSSWHHQQIRPYAGQHVTIYELGYSFYKKSSYKDVIIKWKRPIYDIRSMGPVTLTHASG